MPMGPGKWHFRRLLQSVRLPLSAVLHSTGIWLQKKFSSLWVVVSNWESEADLFFLTYCKVKLNKCWRQAQKTWGSEIQESLWWSQTYKITGLSNNRFIVLQLSDPKIPIKISDNRKLRFWNCYFSMYIICKSIIPLILI